MENKDNRAGKNSGESQSQRHLPKPKMMHEHKSDSQTAKSRARDIGNVYETYTLPCFTVGTDGQLAEEGEN